MTTAKTDAVAILLICRNPSYRILKRIIKKSSRAGSSLKKPVTLICFHSESSHSVLETKSNAHLLLRRGL